MIKLFANVNSMIAGSVFKLVGMVYADVARNLFQCRISLVANYFFLMLMKEMKWKNRCCYTQH